MAQTVKDLSAMQDTQVGPLGQEDPLHHFVKFVDFIVALSLKKIATWCSLKNNLGELCGTH